MKCSTFNLSTLKFVDDTALDKKIFGVKPHPELVAQSVRVYLSNQRQRSAATKTRSQVKVTGRKVWKQKGTGRARHGDRSAPIFIGGARAHGPRNILPKPKSIGKTQRRLALLSALSQKLKDKQVIILTQTIKIKPKTKLIFQAIIQATKTDSPNALIVLDKLSAPIFQGGKNLPKVKFTQSHQLHPYPILKHKFLLIDQQVLKTLK
jgi:large subunit ribosomal protein L4